MLRFLDVALEIGRGLGFVRSTSFVEELEGLIFRYTSTILATMLKVRRGRERERRGWLDEGDCYTSVGWTGDEG